MIKEPMLAPNEKTNLDTIQYPLLASTKLDGIRTEFIEGQMFTRSMKQVPNEQLRGKFEIIRKYAETKDYLIDGEIFSPKVPFQLIQSCVMTQDCETVKAEKAWAKLCSELKVEMTREFALQSLQFHCFDVVKQGDFGESFANRSLSILDLDLHNLVHVTNKIVKSKEEVLQLFEEALHKGQEGLILRDPAGRYKCGRGTIKEGLIYKVKPWVTYDNVIIDVIQSEAVNEDAEKKVNEVGRSVTSKKKEDRHLIEMASCFKVKHNGKDLEVNIALSHDQKKDIWINRKLFIGRMIEYVGMEVGSKDLPRHCQFKGRYREDK
jgi:DNA ligase-1